MLSLKTNTKTKSVAGLLLSKASAALTITALAIASTASYAQEGTSFFGEQATGKWIIGAKVANIDPNIDDVKDSSGIGIVLGYEFDKEILGGKSSFEIEYIQGDDQQVNVNEEGLDYEVAAINAFFTYRSAGDVYFKLKGGLSYVDIDTTLRTEIADELVVFADRDFEETSVAAGVGVGYRFNDRGLVELEYTQDSGDSDLGILGLNGMFTF